MVFSFNKTEDIDENGNKSPNNTLNDLTGKEWLKFLKTWFIHDGPPRSNDEVLHPAKYPETMIVEFIKFFTKKEQFVLDPFLGTGSTLVACNWCGRKGIGIELIEKYAMIAKKRTLQRSIDTNVIQTVIVGDSFKINEIWKERNLPMVDFIICSPPYWNMLRKSRGGVISAQKDRENQGLDTHYSDNQNDIGNVDDYDVFVKKLGEIFTKSVELLKKRKYLVIIIQNMRDEKGIVRPLAWDIAKEVSNIKGMKFQGEKIWCQANKKLGIWGYPKIFIPNYHHHYCLIFQKDG
jgi:DNA modification methylase